MKGKQATQSWVRWRLRTLSYLIRKPPGSNKYSKSTASFSTESWHCGKLKCCSAFSGFHAQWLLGALALKAISAPSGVKLAWIYKSFKAEDWICSLNKGYVLEEHCCSWVKLPTVQILMFIKVARNMKTSFSMDLLLKRCKSLFNGRIFNGKESIHCML